MEGAFVDVHIGSDELALCTAQDSFLAPFTPNDLSADSASTTQLATGGGGGRYGRGGCPYGASAAIGNVPSPLEFQTTPTAEGCGYFDECPGSLYSQPPHTHFPYQSTAGIATPVLSRRHCYDELPETFESTPVGSFTKSFLGMSSVCQGSPMATGCPSIRVDAASSQFIISELDRSLPSDTFHVSKTIPTLSSQPQQMEYPALPVETGMLEPSLTISPALWSSNGGGVDPIVKEETLSRRPSPQRRSEESPGAASKNRWKPNPKQLDYLEQHFRTGYTKATPELFLAVREVGSATEMQVSVWLKNRLARFKRHPDKLSGPRSEGSTNLETDLGEASMIGNKRDRQDEELSDDFESVQSAVLEELSMILQSVDSRDMKGLARAIRDAGCICCYGVNREGLALKAFTISLHNMGFNAYFVGDTNTPPLKTGDLFLVAAGPSYYSTVNALSLEAMRSGARVIAFTAHKTAPLPYVDNVIRIASQTLPPCMPVMNRKLGGMNAEMVSSLPDGRLSIMQMGASFEMALSLALESLCIMIRKKLQISLTDGLVRGAHLF